MRTESHGSKDGFILGRLSGRLCLKIGRGEETPPHKILYGCKNSESRARRCFDLDYPAFLDTRLNKTKTGISK